jgi:hypothetical protein
MLNFVENKSWILKSLSEARGGASEPFWLSSQGAVDKRSEAILFIKPEITMSGDEAVAGFLDIVEAGLQKHDVAIQNIGVLGWRYLSANNIMGQHYGVINRVSREGASALSPDAMAQAQALGQPSERIMGGHEFLEAFPEFNPISMTVLWDNLNAGSKRVAPGTYAMRVQVLNEFVILLNGFHPHQLNHFHGEGQAIVVALVRFNRPWKEMRDALIGETDPTKAAAGSIRSQLLAQSGSLGVPVVNKGLNGIHLSAGPLEGMVEVARFCSQPNADAEANYMMTNFGALLDEKTEIARVRVFAENPMLKIDGKDISAFDATELLDPNEAITLLSNS